ncbi:MAG: quinone-dependent dihydroorotate dehydrogenase [Spirulinaceae cyanobacterium SM2_1_0]|nr:quinone-dependent dihydroorotate dehydrogenase [Spirulinaceae cyanobacterium SM2_1_0]
MDLYMTVLRPLLFSGFNADPEWLHNRSLALLEALDREQQETPTDRLVDFVARACTWRDRRLAQTLWGLEFPNPLGLAAGFDKDGVAAGFWQYLGFGAAELGTVTAQAQPGNPSPRLFRLPRDRAVLNRMGFNNQGSAALRDRLAQRRVKPTIPIGINLGKSKATPLEQAADDYLTSFRRLYDWGDYFAVNVSSPNTPGLRSLQDREPLSRILATLQQANPDRKPLLVKIAPDLSWEAIATVVELARTYELAGIIATNTTIRRDRLQTQIVRTTGQAVAAEAGGISGAPLGDRATAVVRFLWQQTGGTLPIIGVGGIFTATDAWEKIAAGASLLQLYTGWVYGGPLSAKRILSGLSARLQVAGYANLSDAVGCEASA